MAKDDDETGIEAIADEASKDPRMKSIAGDDEGAETETGESDDEGNGVDDCLNEAFDKMKSGDRAGFVTSMKKALGGY